MARKLDENGQFLQAITPNSYLPLKILAPESLKNSIYTKKSDIWAFSLIFWELFTGFQNTIGMYSDTQ